MPSKFKSNLYEMKKRAFEDAVRKHSEGLGLGFFPKVSITEDPCPFATGGEIAHIHLEEKIVCIWRGRLESLNLDQIDDVAAHEVAHMASAEHDAKHVETQTRLGIRNFVRSARGVVIDGGKRVSRSKPAKPEKVREKKICSHYDCNRKVKLRRCKYCKKLFCKEHLNPRAPSLPNLGHGNRSTKSKKEEKAPGHPCPDYYDHVVKSGREREKEELDKRWEALEGMRGLRSSPTKLPPVIIPETHPTPATRATSVTQLRNKHEGSRRPRKIRRYLPAVIAIFALIIFRILWFVFMGK